MILATPGPVEIPYFVRETYLKDTIHHRTPEFKEILTSTLEKFKQITKLPFNVFLASSGSGAMEASVINSVKSKALTINAGKFGERWGKICKAFNIEFEEIKYEWDTPAKVEDVINKIKLDSKIDTFFIQVSESSGGLRHPVEEIAKEIKNINPEIIVVADGITALGVEDIDTTNIDIIVGGSQKAFMLEPGLSMVGISEMGLKRIGDGKGFYFNLANEVKKQQNGTTSFTPAVGIIIALNRVLKELEKVGLDNHYKNTSNRHKAMIKAINSIGLSIFPKNPALSMVAINSDLAEEIRKILKTKYRVHIAGGQDHMKGKLFRINNMGIIEDSKIEYILNSLELALDELKVRKYSGEAVRVYSKEKV